MSNLKHLTEDQLLSEKRESERDIESLQKSIGRLTGKMNNQTTRLCWINTYLSRKEFSKGPSKWQWMMDYCKRVEISPAENWAWDEAEQAFEAHVKFEKEKSS